jgi:hypothetical protein
MPIIRDIGLADMNTNTVPPEMVEEYIGIIKAADLGSFARELTYEEGESVFMGKEALKQAAQQLGIYIKIKKIRKKNAVIFKEISKEEFEDLDKKRKDRAAKMRKGRRQKK